MLQPWIIIVCSLAYISILFAIAYYGDKRIRENRPLPNRAVIYSLSMAVYCTSWTYYGAVGTAAASGWGYLAIYLGPILLVVFGYHFLKKVVTICKEHNITTIADFIASRYGKAQSLSVLVTIIAIMGTLPYIALQLKAVTSSYQVLAAESLTAQPVLLSASVWNDTGFILAAVMAIFSILFGTRYVNASEHHEGIILAIAFESVIKLFALLCVCMLAVFSMSSSFGEFFADMSESSAASKLLSLPALQSDVMTVTFLSQTILAMAAIFCLPRQFHVTFVESTDKRHLRTARWLFPFYLVLTCLVIIPITLAGSAVFSGQPVNPDMFVLTVPIASGNYGLALFAFIGGFSAATSMVIVAVITLSTMICNDIIMPLLFKFPLLNMKQRKDMTELLLIVRRSSIIAILFLSYLYYRYISDIATLASIGLVAFVAAMQFAPSIIGGVYWKKGHRRGATFGLLAGFGVWLYTLFLPTLIDTGLHSSSFVQNGLWGIHALKPYALFGLEGYDPITHALIWSLLLNTWLYIYYSLTSHTNLTDRIQAANFTHTHTETRTPENLPWWSSAEVGELRLLAEKFIGKSSTQKAFAQYASKKDRALIASETADLELVEFTEHLLSGAIGASSARLMVSSMLQKKDMPIEDIVSIVDEASQAVQFNQELLHATIENIDQGVSVVDKDLSLVAWNTRYLEIFNYPSGFIQIGMPIADVIRYNASEGECGDGDIEEQVHKRLEFMSAGTSHSFQRHRIDGTVLQMQGNPMPGGGFVTTFSDITEHKKTEQELIEINENLELRVKERTQELSVVNDELRQANSSKTRLMAAVNHDVMQPLNAARLYTSALQQQVEDPKGLSERISNSLESAEEIIHTLVDISKLDSGAVKANIETFALNDILTTLHDEFSVVAEQKGITLKTRPCSAYIISDPHLLRRILQNFMANALRYTPAGKVLVGCRRIVRHGVFKALRIEVWDTGVGIAKNDLNRIFFEFERLDTHMQGQEHGIGLGLAIVSRISSMLEHNINVKSQPRSGSVFSIEVPVCKAPAMLTSAIEKKATRELSPDNAMAGMQVLCVDNDANVLDAMHALLSGWSCDVTCAISLQAAKEALANRTIPPDIMLVDYHLGRGETGINIMKEIQSLYEDIIPGVLITADVNAEVKEAALDAGYWYLRKPVNPGALRSLVTKVADKIDRSQSLSSEG